MTHIKSKILVTLITNPCQPCLSHFVFKRLNFGHPSDHFFFSLLFLHCYPFLYPIHCGHIHRIRIHHCSINLLFSHFAPILLPIPFSFSVWCRVYCFEYFYPYVLVHLYNPPSLKPLSFHSAHCSLQTFILVRVQAQTQKHYAGRMVRTITNDQAGMENRYGNRFNTSRQWDQNGQCN